MDLNHKDTICMYKVNVKASPSCWNTNLHPVFGWTDSQVNNCCECDSSAWNVYRVVEVTYSVCLLLFIPWVSYSKCWDDCSLLIGPMYQIIVVITFSFVLFPISYTCCDCVGECGFAVYVYYLILKHKTSCFNITGSSWNRWCPWVAGTTRENWTSRFCRPTGN